MGRPVQTIQQYNLIDAGLAVTKEGGQIYDRFRDASCSHKDKRARIIGFGGRTGQLPTQISKLPENPLFHKGKEVTDCMSY